MQALDLLLVMETRLLLAVMPPAGDAKQPLTLASLHEQARVLFFLTHCTRFVGAWMTLLPGSLRNFRSAGGSSLVTTAPS